MARYLIQDHRFLDCFLTLLGAVLASADTFEAKLRFARFIGMVSGEENTYFLRAFEALGVTDDRRAADPDMQPTAGFKSIMREAAETRSYAVTLSVLVVADWTLSAFPGRYASGISSTSMTLIVAGSAPASVARAMAWASAAAIASARERSR
jgi:thiaminase